MLIFRPHAARWTYKPLIALCLLLTSAVAEPISRGKVLDDKTGDPLVGANILGIETQEGTATDTEGYFEFTASSRYPIKLRITHIGYKTRDVIIHNDSLNLFRMDPELLPGEAVSVVGIRSRARSDVSSVIEVVTLEEMVRIGARDLSDALRPLSSVQVEAGPTGKQTVNIRGSNANEVSVFLDGVRLNDANTGVADLSAIDLNDLAQVELIKGGNTTLFGQGAFGGVLNLTSQIPQTNTVTYTRGYGMADDRDQDLSFSASGRLGAFAGGGRFSGKARRYDGRSIYTSIFQTASGAAYPNSGELAAKRYQLNNYLQYPSGKVAQSDETVLNSVRYSGSLFSSPDWELFYGQKGWHWDDTFFSNLSRELKDRNKIYQVAHYFSLNRLEGTLQLESEQQRFDGDNTLSNFDTQTLTFDDGRLERRNRGVTAVTHWDGESGHPAISHVRLELGIRRDQSTTTHHQDIIALAYGDTLIDTLYHEVLDNTFRHNVQTRRLGMQVEGRTEQYHYAVFMNQGNNQRLPTLNDYFRRANTTSEDLDDIPLEPEYLASTEIGAQLDFYSAEGAPLPFHLSLNGGLFLNNYNNKIVYRIVKGEPPIPYNTLEARISGFDLTVEGSWYEDRFRMLAGYQGIDLDNPLVFPNKPEFRIVYRAEVDFDWFYLGYDRIKEGAQFLLQNGLATLALSGRESSNLNITLRRKIRMVNLSLSYTVYNLNSDESPLAETSTDPAQPFQFFDANRRILTLKLSI